MKPQQLKTLTWSDFDRYKPCYSPQKKYGEFSGTILDILQDDHIPNKDKIWAFTRPDVMDDKTLRLFAVKCARQVQHLMKDERSINALDVAEKYANGLATKAELAAAEAAAEDAAWAAAEDVAWVAWAAWAAAEDAAWVAWEAEAAWAAMAAWAAAWDAARDSTWAAAWEAAARAADKALEAAWESQVQIAIELVEEFYQH